MIDVRELSKCQNVYAKLGGIVMPINGFGWHKNEVPATSDEILLKTDWIVRTSPERLQEMSEKYYPQLRLSPSKGENIEFINREIEKN